MVRREGTREEEMMERERRGGGREARHLVRGGIGSGGGKGCQKEGREEGQAGDGVCKGARNVLKPLAKSSAAGAL